MSSYKSQFTVAASPQETFDFCRQAVAESGLQILKAAQPLIVCKEASATKLNAWGGVAQAVTMQVVVSKSGNDQSVVNISGSVLGWFPGHVDGRVGALQNMILVVAKRNIHSPNTGKANVADNVGKGDFINELERLSDLHKSGLLTVDEFQRAKSRLLA